MEIIGPDIKKALQALKQGKILICPTDTVYGLVCDADNKEAVARLYQIKKRPKNKPIPLFVSGLKMAKALVEIDKKQEKFLKKYWPGALTCILTIRGGGGSLGLRIPNHKFVLNLVKHNKGPLAETSANISGRPALTKIKEILRQFPLDHTDGPDLVIDAGDLPLSKPSKVIDLRTWPPKTLRF